MTDHNITLYSTGCPLCKRLEQILKSKNIFYTVCTDENKMQEMGIKHVPMLLVNGFLLKTPQAMQWALGAK